MSRYLYCGLFLCLAFSAAVVAQDDEMAKMMEAWQKYGQPGEQHKLLDPLVGEWNASFKMCGKQGNFPPSEDTCKVEWTLGGRFLRSEYKSQHFSGMELMGYDIYKGKYISLWTDTMCTSMYFSEGTCDESSMTFTFTGKGPDVVTGTEKTFKSVVRIVGPDLHIFEMYDATGGKEQKEFEITYTRKSAKNEYIKFLNRFIGAWQGEGDLAGMGKYTGKLNCQWTLDQNFMQGSYEAKVGEEVVWGELSMWGWNMKKDSPFGIIFGLDGSISKAENIVLKDKDTEVVEGHSSSMGKWRTTVHLLDNDTAYEFTMEIEQEGKFVPFIQTKFHKQTDGK